MTPSAIAARVTYAGSPRSDAGRDRCGVARHGERHGRRYGKRGAHAAGRVAGPERPCRILTQLATRIVEKTSRRASRSAGSGTISTSLSIRGRPDSFEIARANGFHGPYVKLMQAISKHAGARSPEPLPVNAPGAIGAIAIEFGFAVANHTGVSVSWRRSGAHCAYREGSRIR